MEGRPSTLSQFSFSRPKNRSSTTRYALLDEVRGLDLISMMCYHGMWDLIYLFGIRIRWYSSWPGHLWQQSICWIFILLSGFCFSFGHAPLRRGAIVFGAGALVTAVTLVFMPGDVVWFGVLTLLGSSMLLTALLEKLLKRIPHVAGAVCSFALFVITYHTSSGYWGFGSVRLTLPSFLYSNYLTAFFGFPSWLFFSTDYFPLLPWLFLFWTGFYLHHLASTEQMKPLRHSFCPALGWMGRHSLLLYLLHQPVLYGIFSLTFMLLR